MAKESINKQKLRIVKKEDIKERLSPYPYLDDLVEDFYLDLYLQKQNKIIMTHTKGRCRINKHAKGNVETEKGSKAKKPVKKEKSCTEKLEAAIKKITVLEKTVKNTKIKLMNSESQLKNANNSIATLKEEIPGAFEHMCRTYKDREISPATFAKLGVQILKTKTDCY